MLRFPNCKINLGLYVTGKRADGYHDLETVFYPLPLHDALEIVPAEETLFHIHGKEITGDTNQNLVWKAYELLAADYRKNMKPVAIHLLKNIPMGAGLGGGSADGAFMLLLLNDYFGLGLGKEELAAYALKLGSDCPFFIYNTPQFATGRGEQMTPVPIDLSGYSIQVICPNVHISTVGAFRNIQPAPAGMNLQMLHDLPVAVWKEKLNNDFEQTVFAAHPELALLKKALYDKGALYSSMSGSGAAVYGIFEKGNKPAMDMGDDAFTCWIE